MASRETELSELPQSSDPPRGQLQELVSRLIYPFQHGEAPEPRPATGFYTDTTVCIGCKACEVACKQWNQLPSDGFNWSGNSYDNTNELSATTWRHVKFIEQFADESSGTIATPGTESNESRLNRWLMMSDHCKHCVAAPCHQACPTGAIVQNEFQNIYIQADICNGCSCCIAACPFGVITRSDMGGHSHKCTPARWSGAGLRQSMSNPVHRLRPGRGASREGPQTCGGTSRAWRAAGVPLWGRPE
jgi:formate dehydrogenase iron-sulfur subunit